MGVRNEATSFHLVFLSFPEYQDGAAGGAEDGEDPRPCKTPSRLDAEHSECPRGSPEGVATPCSCLPGLQAPKSGNNHQAGKEI